MTAPSPSLTLPSEPGNLAHIRRFVTEAAAAAGFSEGEIYQIILAVDEACTNVIVHGYGPQPGALTVAIETDAKGLTVHVMDQARPFDPLSLVNAPDLSLPLEQRPIGGLGVFLIRENMDNLAYQRTADGGNRLSLTKYHAG
ncbi:MAG: ATP-binding protein [Magnetospiraceae bacterium]